jgi:hypothetical protein
MTEKRLARPKRQRILEKVGRATTTIPARPPRKARFSFLSSEHANANVERRAARRSGWAVTGLGSRARV